MRRASSDEGEVGGGVFEGVGGGSPGVGADRDVVELQPEIERGSLADALDGAALFAEVVCGGDGGGLQERFVGGAGVEVFAAEGVDGGDGRRRGVAIHDVGDSGVVSPAVPLAAVLVGLVEEGLGEVAGNAFGSSSVSNCNCERYTSQPEKVLYCAFCGGATVWTFWSMPV